MKAGDLLQIAPIKTDSFGWLIEFYDITMTHLTPAFLFGNEDEPPACDCFADGDAK